MQRTSYAMLALMLATAASGQDQKAVNYLNESRDGLIAAVKGLNDAQFHFKPAPDRWSIAECLEHIVIVEDAVKGVLERLPQAPAPAANFNAAKLDATILSLLPDRSTKYQAPPEIQPSGRWKPAEALDRFLADRRQLIADLNSMPDLRKHVIPHPVFGPMDGYEWILAASGHCARHTAQILEVKADPRFPR